MRDMCEGALRSQSHSMHKLVGFYPLGPAALLMRVVFTYMWIKSETAYWLWLRLGVAAVVWALAACAVPVVGYLIRLYSGQYMQAFTSNTAGSLRNAGRNMSFSNLFWGATSNKRQQQKKGD